MAIKWIANCSKMPSESNCDLKISGSDKTVVIDAAYEHAIGLHKHNPDEPGLREEIEKMLEQE